MLLWNSFSHRNSLTAWQCVLIRSMCFTAIDRAQQDAWSCQVYVMITLRASFSGASVTILISSHAIPVSPRKPKDTSSLIFVNLSATLCHVQARRLLLPSTEQLRQYLNFQRYLHAHFLPLQSADATCISFTRKNCIKNNNPALFGNMTVGNRSTQVLIICSSSVRPRISPLGKEFQIDKRILEKSNFIIMSRELMIFSYPAFMNDDVYTCLVPGGTFHTSCLPQIVSLLFHLARCRFWSQVVMSLKTVIREITIDAGVSFYGR